MSVSAYVYDVFSLVWLSAFPIQKILWYELGGEERSEKKVGSNKEVKGRFQQYRGGSGLTGPVGAWSHSKHSLTRLTPHNSVDIVVFGFVPRKKLKRRKRSLGPQKTFPNPG